GGPRLPLPGPAGARVRLRSSGTALVGVGLVAAVVFIAVAAPWLAPEDPLKQNLRHRLLPPLSVAGGTSYILGTDPLGRDVLSRLLYGARVSLLVGVASVILAGAVGVVLGLVAGYRGAWWDVAVMRVTDAQLAIPFIVLAVALITVVGAGLKILIVVLTLNGWKTYCRVTRGEVLSLRERDFVVAARSMGAGSGRILFHHLLPNLIGSI